jgi:HSP20 family protein
MTLIRTNPDVLGFNRFRSVGDQLNRLLELAIPAGEPSVLTGWAPALDAHEEGDRFVVALDLPGLKREPIKVSVENGVLTVSGERSQEKSTQEGVVHRTERIYGKFSRTVALPTAVDSTRVTASYKDGVLTVNLPKLEEAKPKQIEVKVA